MRWLASGLVACLLMAAPAWASANASCLIDDSYLRFELEAIAGRAGPITHVQDGTIEIKPAAVKLASPHIKFDLTHIVQQWSLGGDMRLQIEVGDEAAKQNVDLVILVRLNERPTNMPGNMFLRSRLPERPKN